MKKTAVLLSALVVGLATVAIPAVASADQTALSTHSWDPGLQATTSAAHDQVHAWGTRKTAGAWGTGPVNYQAGATTSQVAGGSGTLDVVLGGTYCHTACTYGGGSGYKGLVQFWNDSANYIAFGLIHDPGVSPSGMTLMIEGAANGKPVGGYWPGGAVTGASHLFSFTWNTKGISVTIDHQKSLGPYPVTETHPSISFLAAGRATGDSSDVTFTNIAFGAGSVSAQPITIPPGNPYLTYTATLSAQGSGTGYSAYINAHDASNNAISIGIQSDAASPESHGLPSYIWERVQNGVFTYDYLGPASNDGVPLTLKWWKGVDTAVFYEGSTPVADISVHLVPRLFFNVEGNARINGDSVNDTFTNVQVAAGDDCPAYCGLNGSWNTTDFNFFGLRATSTNQQSQNGANFTVAGKVSGLPATGTWDTNVVAGIAMIAQKWNGQ